MVGERTNHLIKENQGNCDKGTRSKPILNKKIVYGIFRFLASMLANDQITNNIINAIMISMNNHSRKVKRHHTQDRLDRLGFL